MDVSSINTDLIRGNVVSVILKALSVEDRYGYDILREIEVKSQGQYKLKQPTLYSCLKRLEKQGMISSYMGDENDTEGGRRRYYRLTDEGRAYLERTQSEYEYSRTIMDSLLSEDKFDFEGKEAPFNVNSLRPFTKRTPSDKTEDEAPAPAAEPAPAPETAPSPEPAPAMSREPESAPPPADLPSYPEKKKPLFKPLDRGPGSYDEFSRSTTRSFSDVMSELSGVLEKKQPEPEKTAPEPVPPAKPAEKPAEKVSSSEEKTAELEKSLEASLMEFLSAEDTPRIKEEKDVAAAKKILGIGEFAGKKDTGVEDESPERKRLADFKNEPLPQPEPPVFGLAEPFSIFDKYSKPARPAKPEKEPKRVEMMPSPVAPAYTFSFRTDKESVVNYRDTFSSLRSKDNVPDGGDGEFEAKPASNIDLKAKLFAEGYTLRPYSRKDTEEYYSMNFIRKNRINRDCYGLMFVLICLEVLIGWAIFRDRFTSIAYAAVCIIALPVPIIPFVIWSMNPDRRIRASFNFKTSVLNRLMLYLNLLVLVCLIGFFGLNADVNNGPTMIAPILVPALLLLNIPLSSVIYLILYNTKRYHIV